MSATYNWTVTDVTRDISTGGITHIEWECEILVNGEIMSAMTGTTGISYDANADDFVAYDNVTESMVKGWLMETVDQTEVEDTLAAEIATPTTATGLPW